MKRDIYGDLEKWRLSKRRKPLILNGARQVGKTHSLQHFGRHFYKNMAYLNFERDEKLCRYFDEILDPKQLIKTLAIHTEVEIEPRETLLVFDEIQECPKALNSLKYFCEEAGDYHVASAGSLLGVKTANEKGFPVGKVNFLHLYPLTFFEFLSALGHDKTRLFLEEIETAEPIPSPMHDKLMKLLRLYFFVGGMAEAVSQYVKTESLTVVREIQLEILDGYERDFAKHAPANEIMKITAVWTQVSRQLAKENSKFIFAAIRKSARGRDYEDAIQWLLDAGLIHKSLRLKSPKLPLSSYADTQAFKLFLLDVGLLGAQTHLSAQSTIEGNELFTEFKGALTENYVAQELIATGDRNCHYWTSEGTAEVDFVIENDREIYPLEVKAGANQKKKSLLIYDQKYHPSRLLRANGMNLRQDGRVTNFPLYLVSQISGI